jgi:hypothetical protein
MIEGVVEGVYQEAERMWNNVEQHHLDDLRRRAERVALLPEEQQQLD